MSLAATACGVALCALFSIGGASASGSTTIGQVFSTASSCSSANVAQPSVDTYTVPSGSWVVTSWSTYAGGGGGSMALLVLRPDGTPNSYTVVGVSPLQALTASSLNTFTLGSTIATVGGDVIGMYELNSACVQHTGSASVNYTISGSLPTAGSTLALSYTESGDLLNLSATLESVSSSSGTRLGYCSAAGNTRPDGTAIAPGTFLNLAAGQPDTDSDYRGATPAYYYEGIGISCDQLPGYKATGELVGYGGHGDDQGGIYQYMAKTG